MLVGSFVRLSYDMRVSLLSAYVVLLVYLFLPTQLFIFNPELCQFIKQSINLNPLIFQHIFVDLYESVNKYVYQRRTNSITSIDSFPSLAILN